MSDTNFASYTSNELHIKRQRGDDLSIYEQYALTLASIDAADMSQPLSIVDPASASVYAFQHIEEADESLETLKRARERSATAAAA